MATSRVTVGANKGKIRFWMNGTPAEIKEQLSKRFKVYGDRPVVGKAGKEKAAVEPAQEQEAAA